MLIDDQDLYHGAALAQIARHPQFTSINVWKLRGKPSRSAFVINDDIGIYVKYAGRPKGGFKEYQFTFREDHFDELTKLRARRERCFVVLVCVKGRQICCLPVKALDRLRERRRQEVGDAEDVFTVLATIQKGRRFRVYVNSPGTRGKMLGDPLIVSRNSFPNRLFKARR